MPTETASQSRPTRWDASPLYRLTLFDRTPLNDDLWIIFFIMMASGAPLARFFCDTPHSAYPAIVMQAHWTEVISFQIQDWEFKGIFDYKPLGNSEGIQRNPEVIKGTESPKKPQEVLRKTLFVCLFVAGFCISASWRALKKEARSISSGNNTTMNSGCLS